MCFLTTKKYSKKKLVSQIKVPVLKLSWIFSNNLKKKYRNNIISKNTIKMSIQFKLNFFVSLKNYGSLEKFVFNGQQFVSVSK